jgi:tetratricopeptide (TPR) repeat protein
LEARNQALFTLAEIDLDSEDTLDKGVEWLTRAMKNDSEYLRTKAILRQTIDKAPGHAALLALYQRVARQSGDKPMLLEYLARRSVLEDATVEEMREGAQIAFDLGEPAQAEPLLERALELAAAEEGGLASHGWAFEALADCRERAGDLAGALKVLKQAVEATPEEQSVLFTRRLARMAAGPGGNPKLAAAAFSRLLSRDPTDRDCWEPLLGIYRELGDRKRLERLVDETLEVLVESEQRCALRMQHAGFLIEVARAERDAVPVLQELLADEPDHADAVRLLAAIYERQGMNEELADLLFRQFDRAREQRDTEVAVELGLRIGQLLEGSRPQDAVDTYRSALEYDPGNRPLLQALLRALGQEGDPRERAEVKQTLLGTESGPEAESMALELFDAWREINDDEMAQQALELGYRGHPDSQQLRDRLEGWYVERELWPLLGEHMIAEAARAGSVMEGVARLKNAASIYREQLGDTIRSAEALRKALELVPDDLTLLGELARNLAAAGEHRQAIDDVAALLERNPGADRTRVDLLRVRADLYLVVEEPAGAVGDLEEAYGIAGEEVAGKLIDALLAARQRAASDSDAQAERAASFRLVDLLMVSDDGQGAREVLAGWVERNQTDVEALERLRDMDTQAERWPEVARTCELLIEVAEGEELAGAARALAQACEKAGEPQAARTGLERAESALPEDTSIRDALRRIYEQTGADRELAAILQKDAAAVADEQEKVELLRRAAELLLAAGDPEAALVPLGQARELQPADTALTAVVADVYIKLERLDEASDILDKAIEGFKRKRSPELAMLQHRMARLAAVTGGPRLQLDWLNQAMETDRKNGEIASELVETAMKLGEYDAAMKALRIITMMEDPHPMTRAVAFLRQAQIAHLTNDTRRAQHWARKAKSLDPDLAEVDAFLKEIGAT